MRLTQISVVMFTVAAATLAACGGDDGGGGIKIPDAKVWKDAPIDTTTACTAPATVPQLRIGNTGAGNETAGDWIKKNTTSGAISFVIASYLPSDMNNAIIVVSPKPTAGFQQGTFNFDLDPNSTDANSSYSYFEANIDATTMEAGRTLWATNGNIMFSAINNTTGGLITGAIATTVYKEIDDAGTQVAGGCMTSFTGLNFYLKQNTAVTHQVDPSTGLATVHKNTEFVPQQLLLP